METILHGGLAFRRLLASLIEPVPQEQEVRLVLGAVSARFHAPKQLWRSKRNRNAFDLLYDDILGSFCVINSPRGPPGFHPQRG